MNIFLQEPFFLYKLASWNLYFSRKEPFFTVSISYRNWHLANGLFSSFVSICFFPVSVLHTNWSLPKGFFTVIILHKLFLPSQYPAENYSLHFFPFQRSILQRTIPYNFFPFQEVSCRELFPTIFFLSRKYPAENYSLQNFSFPGSILQRTIPYIFFPFQEVSFRELFPTKFVLSRKYPAENYSQHFFSFQGSILQRTIPYKIFSFQEVSCREIFPKKKSFGSIKHTKKSNFTSYRFFSLILAYVWLIFYYICLDLPYVISSPKNLVELITKHFWKSHLNKILEG